MKTAILYTFHEIRSSLNIFLKKGVFYSEDYDFIFICCSETLDLSSFNIPEYVRLIRRKNEGFDFGAWSDVLINENLINKYDYFVFINSSVAGPFVPNYYLLPWPTILTNMLNEEVKLAGAMINCGGEGYPYEEKNAHVQSFAFCTDKIGLSYLIDFNIFSLDYLKHIHDVIVQKEIGMSRMMILNGFNIDSLLDDYKGVDFRNDRFKVYPCRMFSDSYNSFSLSPFQTLFVKINQGNNLSIQSLI